MNIEKDKTHHKGQSKAQINGQAFHFAEAHPTARHMLETAGFTPPDDCILIQVLSHGTRVAALDDKLHLHESNVEVFYAFRGDRICRFTVDERSFDWATPTVKESLLRLIAHVKPDEVLVIETGEHGCRELGPEDELDLAKPETQHLRIEKPLIEVFFKDNPYEIPRGVYTTEQLMAKFPIEQGYLLNLLKRDGELVTLKAGQKIRVHCGMKFYSQVPGGGSS